MRPAYILLTTTLVIIPFFGVSRSFATDFVVKPRPSSWLSPSYTNLKNPMKAQKKTQAQYSAQLQDSLNNRDQNSTSSERSRLPNPLQEAHSQANTEVSDTHIITSSDLGVIGTDLTTHKTTFLRLTSPQAFQKLAEQHYRTKEVMSLPEIHFQNAGKKSITLFGKDKTNSLITSPNGQTELRMNGDRTILTANSNLPQEAKKAFEAHQTTFGFPVKQEEPPILQSAKVASPIAPTPETLSSPPQKTNETKEKASAPDINYAQQNEILAEAHAADRQPRLPLQQNEVSTAASQESLLSADNTLSAPKAHTLTDAKTTDAKISDLAKRLKVSSADSQRPWGNGYSLSTGERIPDNSPSRLHLTDLADPKGDMLNLAKGFEAAARNKLFTQEDVHIITEAAKKIQSYGEGGVTLKELSIIRTLIRQGRSVTSLPPLSPKERQNLNARYYDLVIQPLLSKGNIAPSTSNKAKKKAHNWGPGHVLGSS